MKKIVTPFLILMVILVTAAGYLRPVYARDELTETQITLFMKVLQKVDAKAEPKDDAETIFTYDEGDHIYVTGETPNGWYIVYYRGQTGYVSKNVSQGAETLQNDEAVFEEETLDLEALDDELAAQEVENKLIAEGVERYLTEARRSRMWGVVIVLLVIGIFAVGIVSTIHTENKEQ